MSYRKVSLLALLFSIVLAYFVFNPGQYLNLQTLKAQHEAIAAYQASHPAKVVGTYFIVYVLATALSVPGAVLLTLAGGALFGLLWGTLIVSFASTIGATLAFLMARFVLRDWVSQRFGQRLDAVDKGIEREGSFYLFTLRLVPVFPFFLINLLFGLTAMKARTFFWVSQIGMLAGTLVYVNAGTQLAQLDSLAGILSPALLGSFALLGLFPLVAKKFVAAINRNKGASEQVERQVCPVVRDGLQGANRSDSRRYREDLQRRRPPESTEADDAGTCSEAPKVFARWNKPSRYDRNLVVIGGGSAGLVTAYIAAAVKARVSLVEKHKLGGDCLNTGCVPSKALIRSAKFLSHVGRSQDFGIDSAQAQFRFSELMQRVQAVIKTIEPHDSAERYTGLGVDVIHGSARLVSPWEVEITREDQSTHRLTTRSIVIATGARPFVPAIPGIEDVNYLTSDNVWNLRELPRRLLVLGGGPIGSELTQAFARLGSQVTQIEMAGRIMMREDPEVSELLTARFRAEGIDVRVNHRAKQFVMEDGENILIAEHAGQDVRIPFDAVLVALGRSARLEGFGLEDLGIPTGRTVETNEFLQTNYPNIYAAGDVAGPFQFTHTAAHQAWYAAVNALFDPLKKFKADYSVIPWATFVEPEVARVGLNEQEAKEKGTAYDVTRYGIDDLDRAITDSVAHGFIKVLTVPGKDKILGVTIVGEHAGDLIAEYVLAMKHGIGLNKILGTIHIYPTLAEANKYVAGHWKRAHAPQKLLKWVERFHTWRRG